jgi:hypothetical protein
MYKHTNRKIEKRRKTNIKKDTLKGRRKKKSEVSKKLFFKKTRLL